MILEQQAKLLTFADGNSRFSFLPTGDIYEFVSGDFLINGFQGNCVNGSANNIYLRVYCDNGRDVAAYVPLLGINSESKLSGSAGLLVFSGSFMGIDYSVKFTLAADGLWFWRADLSAAERLADIVYAQDIGVGAKGGVLTNELYISQYLDNKIIDAEYGYTVCSRQNQSQGGRFPYLQQGSLFAKTIGYSTDATQFFGLDFKAGAAPKALCGNLENRNYQFELSFTALQTEKFDLRKGAATAVFYGLFKDNHLTAVTETEPLAAILAAYGNVNWTEDAAAYAELTLSQKFGGAVSSEDMTPAEMEVIFPKRLLEEADASGQLLSFFTEDYSHVVLKEKEIKCERPHGAIITTLLSDEDICDGLITSTNYMYGIFNGQVVAGNTSMHKFISTPRGLLNILKNTGQRIYVKLNGQYRLLAMPAMYEMGLNYSKWYYKLDGDVLIVTSFAVSGASDIVLDVFSNEHRKYDFIVTNQLVMGDSEFQNPILFEQSGNVLTFRAAQKSDGPYPNLHYNIVLDNPNAVVSNDKIFYSDKVSRNGALLTIKYRGIDSFRLTLEGRVDEDAHIRTGAAYVFEAEKERYLDFYKKLNCGFKLSAHGEIQSELDRMNVAVMWFSHNAMVHFAVPHGLEQPGGAAWGTRDVCQGPMEYFLVTGHYTLAKKVLLRIFEHQSTDTMEWPQWFMFDRYKMQAGECHGDVVFWPLKCVCDYITATGDSDILNQVVSYSSKTEEATVLEHIKLAVESIKRRFLRGTALISYAGGDWDDTLQPANKELAAFLVSAWTMALAYQAIGGLGEVVAAADKAFSEELLNIASNLKSDFNKYLIKDGVIAGFAYCEDLSAIRFMLHPSDEETGIHYRLLPLTRSIISEMAGPSQMAENVRIINEKLKCPDGVRLMDSPAHYAGGVCKFFQRAEQAANVGREISLQYTHAHIRYIEAMSKIGSADDAWEGLLQINPVNIKESVPNARLRQSNAYFSSSDGAFDDRYAYQENFDMLRSGAVEVKGGWRIYSSGPGIYFNQLVSNVLGLRQRAECIEIDPVLPVKLDGLHLGFDCIGRKFEFIFHVGSAQGGVVRILLNGKELPFGLIRNPYRKGGAAVSKKELLSLAVESNIVEIFLC